MELLCQVADSYKALVTYDLGKAVRLFQGLPPHHLDTPWALSQVARAYFSAERFKKVSNVCECKKKNACFFCFSTLNVHAWKGDII